MRKEFSGLRIEVVREALKELGYVGGSYFNGFSSSFDSWKKGQTHVIMRERKAGVVVIHIHRDPAFHVGRVRKRGRDLELEVKLILKQMRQPLQHPTIFVKSFECDENTVKNCSFRPRNEEFATDTQNESAHKRAHLTESQARHHSQLMGKETQNKPLFNVFASFGIKTCRRGAYCASFSAIMPFFKLKCQNLLFTIYFLLPLFYSLFNLHFLG